MNKNRKTIKMPVRYLMNAVLVALLFNAEALLQVPATLSLETLQEALETLADDLMVELRQEE